MTISINIKHIAFFLFALLAVYVLTLPQWGAAQEPEPEPEEPLSITGYAWSSTIGWISLDGSNYGLTVEDDDSITGYAWSSNIGWIKFGGLSGFPGGAPVDDDAQLNGPNVVGWARACAGTVGGDCASATRDDGWDGWIYLGMIPGAGNSGVRITNGQFEGYAWGSNVVGWIRFYSTPPDPVVENPIPPPSGCLSVGTLDPCTDTIRIRAGTTATLYWQTINTTSCTVSGTNGDEWTMHSRPAGQTTSPIEAATRYTMTCIGVDGLSILTSSVLINIIPVFQEI